MRLQTLVFLAACAAALASLAKADPFPFVVPWNDAVPSSVDVSFLNSAPAGTSGFIKVRDGHFVRGTDGSAVRFLGTSITAVQAFPTHADADGVAGRLAKYGFNLVRLHYLDSTDRYNTSIWVDPVKDHEHISPERLDAFDYLVAQLEKHGIYVDINLHVVRVFGPADGFPESIKALPFRYSKRACEFDARMIELQRQYARDLVTHVNPYTGRSYAHDPGVFCFEINNEDSLVGPAGDGGGLAELPAPLDSELKGLWNNWLAAKYTSTAGLRAAWTQAGNLGAELLRSPLDLANWVQESHGTAVLSAQANADELDLANTGAADIYWHAQMHQDGLTLQPGQDYTLSFRARGQRSFQVRVETDQADWHVVGTTETIPPCPDWRSFRFVFTAADPVPGHARICFSLGDATGSVALSGLSLRPGSAGVELGPDESIENRSVAIPTAAMARQKTDWVAFVADTETAYARGMRDFLKRDLSAEPMVICSQVSYGGLYGTYRERGMDFYDNHAYWDHPQQSPDKWDRVHGRINNKPMVPELEGENTLNHLARNRVAGAPYTVTEYDHPAPNEYRSETMPLLASMAAYQDWDAVLPYNYAQYGSQGPSEGIYGYFDISSDPALWAFMPSAALIFRNHDLQPAATETRVTLPQNFTDLTRGTGFTAEAVWAKTASEGMGALHGRMSLAFPGALADVPAAGAGTAVLRLQKSDSLAGLFTADAPAAKVVCGFVAGQTVPLQGANFAFGDAVNHYGALTLTSFDGQPLTTSAKALLTVIGRVQNTDEAYAIDRHSLLSWGQGPTLVDSVPVEITLATDGPRVVRALDQTGAPKAIVPSSYANGELKFAIDPAQSAVWWVVEKH